MVGRSAAIGLWTDEAGRVRRRRICDQWRRDHSARGDALLARSLTLRLTVSYESRLPDSLYGAWTRRLRDRRFNAYERRFHRVNAVNRLQSRWRGAGHTGVAARRLQRGSPRIQSRAALRLS